MILNHSQHCSYNINVLCCSFCDHFHWPDDITKWKVFTYLLSHIIHALYIHWAGYPPCFSVCYHRMKMLCLYTHTILTAIFQVPR